MNFLKKNWFLINQLLIIVFWMLFIFYFFKFYNDAYEFAVDETSPVIQLLLITKYRGGELKIILLCEFILVSLNLLNIASYYFMNKTKEKFNKQELIIITISSAVLLFFLGIISMNSLIIINVPLILLSFTVIYISYIVVKHTLGNKLIFTEEVLGEHGPFSTMDELNVYIENLNKYNNLSETSKNIYKEDKKYFVDFNKDKELGDNKYEE